LSKQESVKLHPEDRNSAEGGKQVQEGMVRLSRIWQLQQSKILN